MATSSTGEGTDIDKFTYLKSFFSDSALQSIKGISLNATTPWIQDVNWTYIRRSKDVLDVLWRSYARSIYILCLGGNYKEAIEILREWYGNKQVLISADKQKLDKLPRIKSSNDINGLRKMYHQNEVCVRNLKAMNIDIATYGAILVPFLNGKLPSEIREILSRNFQNDIWQLNDMLKFWKGWSRQRNDPSQLELNLNLSRLNLIETIQHQPF